MKKIISFFLTLTITVLCFPFNVFAVGGEFMVADSVIVVSADASKTDKYAAERLKFYLDKIIGGNMAIVTDNADISGFEICIGESNRTDNDFSSSADGSYVIISSADKLVISGAGNKVANFFLVIALSHVDASVQYPMVTGGVMIVSTLLCFLGPKKPSHREILSVLIGFASMLALFLIPT